jgi:hypothetical protein
MTNTVYLSSRSITVDTGHAFSAMLDAADNDHGDLLSDAIHAARGTPWVFAVPADRVVTDEDFRPHPELSGLDWVAASKPSDMLTMAQRTGCLTARSVLQEGTDRTYLDEGRAVIAVHVTKPFYVVTAERHFVSWASPEPYEWGIGKRTDVVSVGWYLVAEINRKSGALMGSAGMTRLPDDIPTWLYSLNGFDASVCFAHCDTCRADWLADYGSWAFRPHRCDAQSWNFEDATDIQLDSIECPACGRGRVSFDV